MAVLAKVEEKKFVDLLQAHQGQIRTALGEESKRSLDKFLASVMNLVRSNPRLLECDQFSMLNAIREAAGLNLSLDPNLGEASLVPFKGVAKLIPGYRGLIKLACKSGHVSHMQARLFYSQEVESGFFQYQEGTNPHIDHTPMPPTLRGNRMGVYSVAKLRDGEVSFDLLWAEEVERIKAQAPGARSADSAWNTNEDEMWRKTAVRRHIKYLNISQDMGDAVRTAVRDEYFDAGIVLDVPMSMPKATKQIEEKEKEATVVEQTKRGRPKADDKPATEEVPGDESPGGKDTSELAEDSGASPSPPDAARGEGELSLFPEPDEVVAKIREVAEAYGTKKADLDRELALCGTNRDKLAALRLKYIKLYNERMNRR